MIVQNVQGNIYSKNNKYLSGSINNTQNINYNGLGFLKRPDALLSDVFVLKVGNNSTEFTHSILRLWDRLTNNPADMSAEKLEIAIDTVKKAQPKTSEKAILLTMQRLTQRANFSSFETLGKKLNDINVGRADYCDNDLFHRCLEYFIDKKRIIGTSIYNTHYSTYLTKSNLDKYQTQVGNNKYINLEGFDDGINFFTDDEQLASKTIKIINKVKKIMALEPELMFEEALTKVLNGKIVEHAKKNNLQLETLCIHDTANRDTILKQMKPVLPKSPFEIATIIDEFVKRLNPKTPKHAETLKIKIAKYFEKNLIFYTKQDMINSLKNINTQISDYARTHNIDEKNIYFLIPRSESINVKSFGVVTEMNKKLFNIPNEKLKQTTFYDSKNKFPENSAIVILDDATISGETLAYAGDYTDRAVNFKKDKHILFCPIIAYKEAIDNINKVIKKNKRTNIDVIITTNTINSPQKFNLKNILNNLFFRRSSLGKLAFDYYPNSRNANEKVLVLPYMSPDNNPALATILTQLFIPCHTTTGITAIKNNHLLLQELNQALSKIQCK